MNTKSNTIFSCLSGDFVVKSFIYANNGFIICLHCITLTCGFNFSVIRAYLTYNGFFLRFALRNAFDIMVIGTTENLCQRLSCTYTTNSANTAMFCPTDCWHYFNVNTWSNRKGEKKFERKIMPIWTFWIPVNLSAQPVGSGENFIAAMQGSHFSRACHRG